MVRSGATATWIWLWVVVLIIEQRWVREREDSQSGAVFCEGQFSGDSGDLIEVAVVGGEVERGVAGVAFYGGEQFSGDSGNLIEVTVPGGVVEWGPAVVVFYAGEE